MNDIYPQIITEAEARTHALCIGCGHTKDREALVCWHCFKSRPRNLKYSGKSFAEWQVWVRA